MNVNQDPSPVNYEPNSFVDSPKEVPSYTDTPSPIVGQGARQQIEKTDDFTQAGEKYRSYTQEEKDHLIHNLVNDLKQTPQDIQLRAICNFFRADIEYGMRVAAGLGVDVGKHMPQSRP
ncbi:catalase-related domain-containing protein [Paenibacillus hexagrammi]|uniref:catalase n=1 Tax=Paenibacillus hexagrammi TaxID=2908839 RepID=A0ABY3SRA3_9BACL|nr:catalase-related domain-containing protein [Paenibacillus sp. YPD9-1]UJF36214.1 hypothetical protein L0M14_01265 [Paenibacillus sp. YPD9-1]